MKILFSVAVFALSVIPVSSDQSIDGRLAELTGQVAPLSVDDKLAALKTDFQNQLDGINAKLDKLIAARQTDPFSPVLAQKKMESMCPGCTCGCATTGVCTCGAMTQAPKKMTSVKWVCSGNSCQQVAYESTDGGVTWAQAGDQSTVGGAVYAGATSVAYVTGQPLGAAGRVGLFAGIRERRASRRGGGSGACASCGN